MTTRAEARCLNCDAPLAGPYCSQCGQEDAEAGLLSTRLTFHDVLEDLVQVDGRLARDVRDLVARPGLLTAAFLAGRRARHLAPAKLYLLVNFVFFVLVQWFDPVTAEIAAETVGPEAYAGARAAAGAAPAAFDAAVEGRIATALPTWLVVLVPAMAALLALLHLGGRRPFAAYAAFAFHLVAFLLVALTPGTVVGGPAGEALLSLVLFAALPAWIVLALRRAFGQGWAAALARGALTWLGLVLAVAVYLWVVTAWGVAGA